MTPEGKVKADICEFLDSLGEQCWYFKPMMMGYGRKGIPDIIGCFRSRFFSVEVKAPGKIFNLTPWQEAECESIMDSGGLAFTADNPQKFKEDFLVFFPEE